MLSAGLFEKLPPRSRRPARPLPPLVAVRDAHEPTLPESLRPARGTAPVAAQAVAGPRRRRVWLWVLPPLAALIGVALALALGGGAAGAPAGWQGVLEARSSSVGSRTAGRVKEVLVHEGDLVVAGQPLVVLEEGDLRARLVQAEGEVEQASAILARLAGASTDARVAEVEGRERVAEHDAKAARRELRRARARRARGDATRAEVAAALEELRAALARHAAARQELEEAQHGPSPEARQEARGRLTSARGRAEALKLAIEELTIYAPGRARVDAVEPRAGDLIAADAPLVELSEDDQPFVRVTVPRESLGRVAVGDAVAVEVDGLAGHRFEGRVEHIHAEGIVRVRVKPEGTRLRLGVTARIRPLGR